MEKLIQLRKEIVSNGLISQEEVETLREELFSDGGMTKEKGDFLFDFKNLLSKDKVTSEFSALFVDAISSLLLEDDESPGEIDESEAKWLRAKVQMKGYQDKLDQMLLDNLRKKSINFPEILNYKTKASRLFETALYFSRFLTLFAVVGSLISALVLFIRGTMVVIYGLLDFFKSLSVSEAEEYEKLLAAFVSSVDIFLFAMVLLIFGMGIYELFINKIDPVERKADARPSWLQIKSIDELKSSLGKVILMVLIVSFFKHSLDISFEKAQDLLYLSIGVLLVAASLYIANKSHH
ncbi:MAG: YqhA family protein [Prevotella sp.]|nr:YqhA family protein [Prevotella sp.]